MQGTFATQALQAPLRHTSLRPQVVPLARLVPESTQTGAPVEQEMEPVWQAFVGVQAVPATQVWKFQEAVRVPRAPQSMIWVPCT